MVCGECHHCQTLRQSGNSVNLTRDVIAPHVAFVWQIIDSSVHNQPSLGFSIVDAGHARRCVVDSISATLGAVDHNEHEWHLFCDSCTLMPVIATHLGVD